MSESHAIIPHPSKSASCSFRLKEIISRGRVSDISKQETMNHCYENSTTLTETVMRNYNIDLLVQGSLVLLDVFQTPLKNPHVEMTAFPSCLGNGVSVRMTSLYRMYLSERLFLGFGSWLLPPRKSSE